MAAKKKSTQRIGEALIRIGAMTEAQVQQVLTVQREKYNFEKLFGEIALELQLVDQETIERILDGTYAPEEPKA
jgi:hypothetical protein